MGVECILVALHFKVTAMPNYKFLAPKVSEIAILETLLFLHPFMDSGTDIYPMLEQRLSASICHHFIFYNYWFGSSGDSPSNKQSFLFLQYQYKYNGCIYILTINQEHYFILQIYNLSNCFVILDPFTLKKNSNKQIVVHTLSIHMLNSSFLENNFCNYVLICNLQKFFKRKYFFFLICQHLIFIKYDDNDCYAINSF